MCKSVIWKVICLSITAHFALGLAVWAQSTVKEDYYSHKQASIASALANQVATPPIDWPVWYGVQQTGFLNASFDDRGTFGIGFGLNTPIPAWPSASFETPSGSDKEYLWMGSIWVGGIVGDDTLVTVGADGWQYNVGELFPPTYPTQPGVSLLEGFSDFSMRAVMVDTMGEGVYGVHKPLNIQLANRSHAWHDEDNNRSVLYDLTITNMGDELIEAGYVGFYFDGDVGLYSLNSGWYLDDMAGSLRSEGIGYIIDNDGDPIGGEFSDSISVTSLFAFKFLHTSFEALDTSFHWWVSNGNPALDYGPRRREHDRLFCAGNLGTPVCDVDRYYLMSHPEWDFDQVLTASISPIDPDWLYPPQPIISDLSDGWDTRMFMSIGPFDLMPDSSVRVQYITFATDSIHTDPGNYGENVSREYRPYNYIDNLEFDSLFSIAARAEVKASQLLNPLLPPTGLALQAQTDSSLTLAWDPFVFDSIEGYDLYLTPLDPSSFPHPGVIPPWINHNDPGLAALLNIATEHTLSDYDYQWPYLAHVAHRTSSESGLLSLPAIIAPYGGQMPTPTFSQPYGIVTLGEMVNLEWIKPEGIAVDHYNIYRFDSASDAYTAYSPFYSKINLTDSITPSDSIEINSQIYYFYQMEPDYVVDGSLQSVEVPAENREVYIVTAVDNNGYESDMTAQIEIMAISPKTKDLLVITSSTVSFTTPSVISSFYERVFCGTELNHNVSVIYLDCVGYGVCPELLTLTQYDLVIVDDNTYTMASWEWWNNLAWYMATGGKLATFSYQGLVYGPRAQDLMWEMTTRPAQAESLLGDYFSIDSALCVTPAYYLFNGGVPANDTLFGLHEAESQSPLFSSLSCDTARYPLPGAWSSLWPPDAPPEVTIFAPGPNGAVTHTLGSLYPETSLFQGAPIGVQTFTIDNYGVHETHAFGFHLHHMKVTHARALIGDLLGMNLDCCGAYTNGVTGNVDFDPLGKRNIADITCLIDRVYVTQTELCCEDNGNIDGDVDAKINVADITRLIDHIYSSKEETAACE